MSVSANADPGERTVLGIKAAGRRPDVVLSRHAPMTPPWQNTATAPESTRDKPLHRSGNPSAKLHHHRVVTGVSHQRPPLTK